MKTIENTYGKQAQGICNSVRQRLYPLKDAALYLGRGIDSLREMIYAGVDPNGMRFKRTGCFDVGLECGGWGRIVLELQVEDRA